MDDDFNTPEALSVLFEMVSEIHQLKGEDPALANQLGALLVRLGGSLGLLQAEPAAFLQHTRSIQISIQRKLKDWLQSVLPRERVRIGDEPMRFVTNYLS